MTTCRKPSATLTEARWTLAWMEFSLHIPGKIYECSIKLCFISVHLFCTSSFEDYPASLQTQNRNSRLWLSMRFLNSSHFILIQCDQQWTHCFRDTRDSLSAAPAHITKIMASSWVVQFKITCVSKTKTPQTHTSPCGCQCIYMRGFTPAHTDTNTTPFWPVVPL